MSSEKLNYWRAAGINRLSVGTQTFNDDILKSLNRSHNAIEAKTSLENAKKAGFDNISSDLIFAIPPQETSTERFNRDLQELADLDLQHISLYNLTVEQQTYFGHLKARDQFTEVDEDAAAEQLELAQEYLSKADYEQYEVSNFAKDKKYSRHNSSYWKSQLYLGVGPGAHSYDQATRKINISNNAKYIKSIESGEPYSEQETLTEIQQLNEYLLTRLRTKWGIDLELLRSKWGYNVLETQSGLIDGLLTQGMAEIQDQVLRLNSKGLLLADEIALRMVSDE